MKVARAIAKALHVPVATVLGESEAKEQPKPCATCGSIGALMGRWCRRCHPDRCTHTRADGSRCRAVGVCAVHAVRAPGGVAVG